jgi:hypothetical protein
MQLLSPDFYSSIHRTIVDIAALALLVIGLARIILHDWRALERPRRKKRPPNRKSGNHHAARPKR